MSSSRPRSTNDWSRLLPARVESWPGAVALLADSLSRAVRAPFVGQSASSWYEPSSRWIVSRGLPVIPFGTPNSQ